MITLTDTIDVLEDGKYAGALADTIRNRPELTSEIQRALGPKLTELVQARDAAIAAAQAKTDAVTAEFASYKARAEGLIKAAISAKDDHDALKLVVNQAQAESTKTARQLRADQLSAQIAKLQSEIAGLQ